MDDFEALISGIEVDPHLEEREELLAKAAALRAQADALEAEAQDLGKTTEERDCKIEPNHFEPDAAGARFLAPDSERAKMRAMIPSMRAAAHKAGIMRREIDTDEIMESMPEDMPEELREQIIAGMTDALASAPSVATVDVVEGTLCKQVLSLEEVRAWRTLFGGMLQSSQGVIEAVEAMAEMAGAEIAEDELAGQHKQVNELKALVERLDTILK